MRILEKILMRTLEGFTRDLLDSEVVCVPLTLFHVSVERVSFLRFFPLLWLHIAHPQYSLLLQLFFSGIVSCFSIVVTFF